MITILHKRTDPGSAADPRDARIAALEAQLRELAAATKPIARQAVLVRTTAGDAELTTITCTAGQIRRAWRALEAVDPAALPRPRAERMAG